MKLKPIVLIIAVGVLVYIGLNLTSEKNRNSQKDSQLSINQTNLSQEEQRKEFADFYQNIYDFVDNFEEIDQATTKLEEQSPSKTEQYEYFSKLKAKMEEGESLPFSSFIPEGFNESQNAIMQSTVRELKKAFRYRKYGYDRYLEYLETGDSETYHISKEWIKSADICLHFIIINLEDLKGEFGLR